MHDYLIASRSVMHDISNKKICYELLFDYKISFVASLDIAKTYTHVNCVARKSCINSSISRRYIMHLFFCSRHVRSIQRLLTLVCVVQLVCTQEDYQWARKLIRSKQVKHGMCRQAAMTTKMKKLATMMTSITIGILYRRGNFYRFCCCHNRRFFTCPPTTPRAVSESNVYI